MKSKKINKKALVAKFVEVPLKSRREFWQREYVLLNRLIERYSIDFLKDTTFSFKGESLAILFAEKILKELDFRFKIYTSSWKKSAESIVLSDDESVEKRKIERKPKTIRDFLNGKD